MPKMHELSIELDKEQHEKLRELAAKHRVSMSVLVRNGVSRLLELAEKQQATTDRWLAEQDSS